ncbi:rhomboid family intramembrane serine protease [Agromyces laixinhei]|uniref:rhomboid family intramembrane serine protease n=1 Tax=Agromyces laixinhei TaxID=2585717 RepID=UPI0012EDE853|nr:rhomboid family intramembrane serine protease [Agromyces laixinhei]
MESLALGVITATTVVGTMLHLRRTGGRFRFPKVTLVVAAVTLVISVLGDLDQHVLDLLGRDRSQLLDGEWWRMITPLFVQDGAWLGTIFNISSLIVIGLCAETLYNGLTFVCVYFAAGIVSEAFAYTLMPHQGFAGNSVANMGAAGLCLVTLCAAGAVSVRIVGITGVLGGIVLIATGDLHGVGFAVGAVAALIAIFRSRRRQPSGGAGLRS